MRNEELTWQFIAEHREDDVRQLALRQKQKHNGQKQYPQDEVDIAFALQQIQGWQRARHKLPTISQIVGWQYPPSLSVEQCSSELTARHKTEVLSAVCSEMPSGVCNEVPANSTLIDLTGGMGIDTYFLSDLFNHTLYIERQPELAELARQNFALTDKNIEVKNANAEDVLTSIEHAACIYCDPARRSSDGGKVFRLADCTPDLTTLYPMLAQKADLLMFKLSPMLDLTEALRTLTDAVVVEIVAVRGEVKELLIVCQPKAADVRQPEVRAVNLGTTQPTFSFNLNHTHAQQTYAAGIFRYIYEPNAALMKAGCFDAIAEQYRIAQLAHDSHLFTSDMLVDNFPGRVFLTEGIADKRTLKGQTFSVISRNYPLSADRIRQRYRLTESDRHFIIATRLTSPTGDVPVLICATRI